MNAGENFLITWENEKYIENIRLDYSPDNGSTYLTIKDRIPNIGYYKWQIPHHISSNCLVRVSNADGMKPEKNILLYDLRFKINSLTSSSIYRKDFVFCMGDTNTPNTLIPEISIFQESNGKEYLCFEENIKEIGRSREFHNCWHMLKILADYSNDRISILLDDKSVFENFSMSPQYQFNPAVSFSTEPCDTTDVEIDDFTVRVLNSIDKENKFVTLFTEDFKRFEDGRFPKNSGWQGLIKIEAANDFSNDNIDSISVQSDSINGNKSLKINNSERNPFIVVKHFNIPKSFPFDVSDRVFEIRYNGDMEELSSHEPGISRHRVKSFNNNIASSTSALTSTLALENKNTHGPNTGGSFGSSNSNSRFGTIQSTSTVDTYYIYSFDGKLMAEYDHNGNCVKDYIYAGNRLIAEYQPQTGKYYYYMNDQINSTRIVTDDNGNIVYSEAYGPFGGVQKNWTKTYDPKLKFSSKEREAYGDLDYFGARYYDHNSYRFISTDPIINREEALSNPQLWNLYSYCRNNPITFFDPNGKDVNVSVGNTWLQLQQTWGNTRATAWAGEMAKDMTENMAMELVGAGVISAIGKVIKCAKNIIKISRLQKLAKYSGILRNAAKFKGNFSIGKGTFNEAMELGKAWVGKGYKVASDGKTLISKSGLRQFRPPSFKPNLGLQQANFEWRLPGQKRWLGNAHFTIE